jgi:hypothetical protein
MPLVLHWQYLAELASKSHPLKRGPIFLGRLRVEFPTFTFDVISLWLRGWQEGENFLLNLLLKLSHYTLNTLRCTLKVTAQDLPNRRDLVFVITNIKTTSPCSQSKHKDKDFPTSLTIVIYSYIPIHPQIQPTSVSFPHTLQICSVNVLFLNITVALSTKFMKQNPSCSADKSSHSLRKSKAYNRLSLDPTVSQMYRFYILYHFNIWLGLTNCAFLPSFRAKNILVLTIKGSYQFNS